MSNEDKKNEQELYFKNMIEMLKELKRDLMVRGRARHTEGVGRETVLDFVKILKEVELATDEFKREIEIPKSKEALEKEQREKELEEAKAKPLSLDQYIEALRLEKKGLSIAQIAKLQNINERAFRESYVASRQRYGNTQSIADRVAQIPEGEQDYVLEARSSDPYSKPRLIFLEIYRVKTLLRDGLKPKAIAERLGLNPDSFKSWLKANKKYLEL